MHPALGAAALGYRSPSGGVSKEAPKEATAAEEGKVSLEEPGKIKAGDTLEEMQSKYKAFQKRRTSEVQEKLQLAQAGLAAPETTPEEREALMQATSVLQQELGQGAKPEGYVEFSDKSRRISHIGGGRVKLEDRTGGGLRVVDDFSESTRPTMGAAGVAKARTPTRDVQVSRRDLSEWDGEPGSLPGMTTETLTSRKPDSSDYTGHVSPDERLASQGQAPRDLPPLQAHRAPGGISTQSGIDVGGRYRSRSAMTFNNPVAGSGANPADRQRRPITLQNASVRRNVRPRVLGTNDGDY